MSSVYYLWSVVYVYTCSEDTDNKNNVLWQ